MNSKTSDFFSQILLGCLSLQFFSTLSNVSSNSQDLIWNELKQLKIENENQNQKIKILEIENKEKDHEIRLLKTKLSNIKDDIKFIPKSPSYITKNSEAADTTADDLISKFPSNCKELGNLGHSINGIYLVQSKINSKIEAIFCNFKSSDHTESILGYVDVKSGSGVHFYVQRGAKPSTPAAEESVITYDVERLNIGKAMHLKSGVFTAPKSGIYCFSFSILKSSSNQFPLDVSLRLNGTVIGHSSMGFGRLLTGPATLQSTLKLRKGDRVDLWQSQGSIFHGDFANNHFTGWLLEEDFEKFE